MISLQGETRIFIALGPTYMRKGFDALAAIVAQHLKLNPLSGQLFLYDRASESSSKNIQPSTTKQGGSARCFDRSGYQSINSV
jgi:hypothetical protein